MDNKALFLIYEGVDKGTLEKFVCEVIKSSYETLQK